MTDLTLTTAGGILPGDAGESRRLKRALRRTRRRESWSAVALLLPLALVTAIFFLLPIASLLTGAVHSPDYASSFPRSAALVAQGTTFDEGFYAALFADISEADAAQNTGAGARRLNQDMAGFTTMLKKTTRKAREGAPAPGEAKAWFESADPRWVDPEYQAAIARSAATNTDFFLLKSVDLQRDTAGKITAVPPDQALFRQVLLRTLTISLGVTFICCVLGYPLAWALVNASAGWRRIMLTGVLFPFWTSLLVRSAAWVIVLQKEGPINSLLMKLGIISEPLTLVFNRFGVMVALTHVLLPFLVLPLYSVMRGIPRDYLRAAKSLGAKPTRAFLTAYVPLTLPGLGAGAVLVFIMAIGYYITPALVGGPNDQMISYFIAFYTNNTINWGLASALALNLLAVTLVLYALYRRLTAPAGGMGGA
ncbi:MAG: ABC transporter permease [Amaricoccus sp.]|uniref:ABC transporter permease n=1 Tax=Amaricoccus sp. TaxID=1872485 RepID=UPI0039E541EB